MVLGPLVLAGCSAQAVQGTPSAAPASAGPSSAAPVPTSVEVPASPVPAADGKCPYLDSTFVADANGQRVSRVRVSQDQPPACFFYRADGRIQLTVQVFVGEPSRAKALVDQAAPVATANPAELPGGWAGGAQANGSNGAVFAVAKEGKAVVITTNQAQTIKAKRVAEQAITALGF
jgi:hypothetical protein